MRRRNRAILADITDLGLDPKKPYTKVSKTGNLVDDIRKEKIVEKILQKQKVDVEVPVEKFVKPIVLEPIKVEEKIEVTSVEEFETPEVVEDTSPKIETTTKTPFANKKKKK